MGCGCLVGAAWSSPAGWRRTPPGLVVTQQGRMALPCWMEVGYWLPEGGTCPPPSDGRFRTAVGRCLLDCRLQL